jgi:succinyl-diaminopimelate desuccinylase
MISPTQQLTEALIRCSSVTPNDAGCQELLIERLQKLGFVIERMRFGEVENLWARYGNSRPLVVFAGHTDVVPTGPLEQWISPPFTPTIREGYLYGRGAADMKASLAAFVTAIEAYLTDAPEIKGSIGLLITADEEGPAINGTLKVIEALTARGEVIDYCIVGEPTSDQQFGDTIKNGRRGSLSGKLTVQGIQGHIAYPQLAKNPIHLLAPALAELTECVWDTGNAHFPPTSWQVSNINAGTGVGNVIPGNVDLLFNFRFSTENTEESLRQRVHDLLDKHQLDYQIEWTLSGLPYLTPAGQLTKALSQAIKEVTDLTPVLSTTGGTSDGRYIAQYCEQVVEFGPINATIHKINECIATEDLEKLFRVYHQTLHYLL